MMISISNFTKKEIFEAIKDGIKTFSDFIIWIEIRKEGLK